MTFPRIHLAVLLLLPFAATAQEPAQPGIHFEKNESWTAVRAKAKREHRYLFVDCFTTWCGPCRFMTTQIFPQAEAGNYYNDKFVCVAVQLDTTAKDNPEVKSWYHDAHDIAKEYHVNAYPTYLIFAPDGHIVHRMLGSTRTVADFLKESADAFDTSKQYYTRLAQYEHGRRDSTFLRTLSRQSIDLYDQQNSPAIVRAYLKTQVNLYTKGVLDLLVETTSKSTDQYFTVFTDHAAEVDAILGAGAAAKFVREVYLREGAGLVAGASGKPDWSAIRTKIATRLPAQADELTLRIKVNYYRHEKDWPDFSTAITQYMNTYAGKMSIGDLNSIAWSIFVGCPDMSCVTNVLDWGVQLKQSNVPAFMDTYANILYKLGHHDDAIALEQKAVDLSAPADKSDLQATLDKWKQTTN